MYFFYFVLTADLNKRDVLPMETQNTNGNSYLNAFFGLTIEKPEGWLALSSKQIGYLLSDTESTSFNNKTPVQQYNQGETVQIIPLFRFEEDPLNILEKKQDIRLYARIIGLALNLTGEEITGDYCYFLVGYNKGIRENGNKKIMESSVCRQIDINGVEFTMQELTLNVGNSMILKQTEIVRNTNTGYIIFFILSYTDDKSKTILEHTMNTLKFS
ncbi:unnamed protein product [Adineta steineri]|uniref:Uncharacterized protein n=1 Tax=Adineta steineri TaxID=433720 RepID=A0A818ZMH3_9BILA|nr:unnamed protein product [Adineta steineri]CAF1215835.1 unnamed protein product [Adineta steineri]CAF3771158.1 unnamed protein product [Adineta steineri]CAF4102151.1 unnamed protein product [Adineta steineri]